MFILSIDVAEDIVDANEGVVEIEVGELVAEEEGPGPNSGTTLECMFIRFL